MSWMTRHGGTWKVASPFVRHGGTWKAATPYVRDGGLWKPLTSEAYQKSFLGVHGPVGTAASFTITGADLGAASATREIFVVVVWRSSATRNLTSVTIAGVTATLGSQANYTTLLGVRCAWATVPAGTSGNIVLGFSGSVTGLGVSTYRVVGRPVGGSHTDFRSAGDLGVTTLTVPGVSVSTNGFILSAVTHSVFTVPGGVSVSGLSVAIDGAVSPSHFGSSPIRTSGSGPVVWTWANPLSALAATWSFR